ncbi:hypothetical protein FS749_009502 [Ceratobasidium sp. UAMH 11750]|nr:hypothetical protein FS749_009502 [Ceratobasidium sp. UAMH 11750]
MEENALSREYAISAVPPLVRVYSLDFPRSFLHDFMHLIFENIVPTLIDLWTHDNKYKTFGTGDEPCLLDKTVWSAIGEACARSGDTIPAAFGRRVPNIRTGRGDWSAESWLLFTTLLAPALLRHRFREHRFYAHFLKLVCVVTKCLRFVITCEDLDFIRAGLAEWVVELYYQHDRDRLRVCNGTPLRPACPSHQEPSVHLPSLGLHVLEVAQLSQIKLIYGLADYLDLSNRRHNITNGTRYPGYIDLFFATPRRHDLIPQRFRRKVATYLSTILEIPEDVIMAQWHSRKLKRWGRMQQIDESGGGDVVHADDIGCNSEWLTRNESYVKFYIYLSRWNWNRTAPRLVNEITTSFGRTESFIVIDVEFICHLSQISHTRLARTDPIIIAMTSPFVALKLYAESDLIEYKLTSDRLATAEIADVHDINCLIGRVRTASASYIVDRTTIVGQLNQLDVTVNPD